MYQIFIFKGMYNYCLLEDGLFYVKHNSILFYITV